jgi:hypothetical protein
MSMSLQKTDSQARIFCARVLPSLFHGTPEQFLGLLHRDGNKFLRFYWDLAGKDLPDQLRSDAFGLNYVMRAPSQFTVIALISLPEPQNEGDTHYMALIYRPNRRLFFVSDMTKIISLEKTLPGDPTSPATRMVEISRRLERETLRTAPVEPRLEEFYQAVLKELD